MTNNPQRNKTYCNLFLLSLLTLPLPAAACLLCTCDVSVTAGKVDFGAYTGSDSVALGTITVHCSGALVLVKYTVKLSTGLSLSFNPRQMDNGGNLLDYNLYTDSARTMIWDNSTNYITDSIQILLGGSSKSYSIYGRIPGGQTAVHAGAYLDNITATLDYD